MTLKVETFVLLYFFMI